MAVTERQQTTVNKAKPQARQGLRFLRCHDKIKTTNLNFPRRKRIE
jgi:hypothetical protein